MMHPLCLSEKSFTYPRMGFIQTTLSIASEGICLIAFSILNSWPTPSMLEMEQFAKGIGHLFVAPIALFGVLAPQWMSQWIKKSPHYAQL